MRKILEWLSTLRVSHWLGEYGDNRFTFFNELLGHVDSPHTLFHIHHGAAVPMMCDTGEVLQQPRSSIHA